MKRRLLIGSAIVLILALSFAFCWTWFARHHSFCSGGVCVYYEEEVGQAGDVFFEVKSGSGVPLRGVFVNTYSNSGWEQGARTDGDGRAAFQAREWEVLAVQVGDGVIQFWPTPVDLFAGPDTGSGVRFRVVVGRS